MAIELLGAKMLTPFYGASLYVWTSVFVVTLGGLASGYFLGGRVAVRMEKELLLFCILLGGAVFMALMPAIAPAIMNTTFSLGIRMGSLISCIAFMMMPLICMGMVSPLIIELSSKQINNAGKTAGTIYAVSTVGGIITTLLLGFFVIPEFGIKKTILTSALILALCPILYFIIQRKKMFAVISAVAFMLFALQVKPPKISPNSSVIKYQSEGLLGQIMVVDNPITVRGTRQTERRLFVNRIMQSYAQLGFEGCSIWPYPHRISILASIKPAGAKALVMGYGGGSIAWELLGLGFETKGVELDKRIKDVADNFFFTDESRCPIIIDDARHYTCSTSEKYDLVVFDLLCGEEQPSHVFTMEGLTELKNILNKNALVLVNFQGEMEGDFSLAARSVFYTLSEAGYNTRYSIAEDPRSHGVNDIVFAASPDALPDFSMLSVRRINKCCQMYNFHVGNPIKEPLSEKQPDLSDAFVLADDKPILEILVTPTVELWRKNMILQYTDPFTKSGIPLFQ